MHEELSYNVVHILVLDDRVILHSQSTYSHNPCCSATKRIYAQKWSNVTLLAVFDSKAKELFL